MSTLGGCFGEQGSHFGDTSSQLTGCFGEVQVDPKNGKDSLNSIRDESGEVGMKLSSRALWKRESDFVEENRKQQIHPISPSTNNKIHDDLKTPVSFISLINWKSEKKSDQNPEKNFEYITDQIKKRQKIVKGRNKCVSIILKILQVTNYYYFKNLQHCFSADKVHLFSDWKVFNV